MSQISTSISLVIVSLCALLGVTQFGQADDPHMLDHYLLHDSCSSLLNEQISLELYASIVYLNMAAYFDRPTVARAGYSKYFRDQSLEEYGHAGKFIDYINQRNGTVRTIAIDESPKSDWQSPREALSDAIKLEKHVYAKLRHIHQLADQKCQDPHLTDYLESYFFTEQVDSIHELQVLLSKLENSNNREPGAGAVVEYLEDKVLLKGKKEQS